MTIGQRIQQIRLGLGLSQEEFGAKLGTTRQTVSRWELDQSYPELAKIVLISRLFSVTTDSILKDGITTFDNETEVFACGVYRSANAEIVETEKYALKYYSSPDKSVLGTKLYAGYGSKKRLVAVCERNQAENVTEYAYFIQDSDIVISNCDRLGAALGEAYDTSAVRTMRRLEKFYVDHSAKPLPKVKEAGFSKCLTLWRMADSYRADADQFSFSLCTGKTDYIFSVIPEDANIYCGASYNIVFDIGLFGGRQFFRIRNYKDNREEFCGFSCDFSYEAKNITIPIEQCVPGKYTRTDQGLAWAVKRYTDDEIVLQGCDDDEYKYCRLDQRDERFMLCEEKIEG